MDFTKELELAKEIALSAGEIIKDNFDVDFHARLKEDKSVVTDVDISVNSLVIEKLSEAFPNDGIIGEEESTAEYGMGRKWLCDPLDGTVAYVWGVPTSMFSLALVIDGKPVVGVAYDPYLKKMYEGVHGNGSFCNGVRLHVSDRGLKGGHVAVTADPSKIKTLPYISKLQEHGAYLPLVSGAVYKSCLVAKGRFEGYIEHGVNGHDMAAVEIIVTEAGGKITGIEGNDLDYSKPFKGAIVSNGKVHQELVGIVNSK